MDALAEVEYYNGFKGKEAAAKTLREASQMVVDFVRRMQWHDTKTDPPKKEDSDHDGKVLVWHKDLWTASMPMKAQRLLNPFLHILLVIK